MSSLPACQVSWILRARVCLIVCLAAACWEIPVARAVEMDGLRWPPDVHGLRAPFEFLEISKGFIDIIYL